MEVRLGRFRSIKRTTLPVDAIGEYDAATEGVVITVAVEAGKTARHLLLTERDGTFELFVLTFNGDGGGKINNVNRIGRWNFDSDGCAKFEDSNYVIRWDDEHFLDVLRGDLAPHSHLRFEAERILKSFGLPEQVHLCLNGYESVVDCLVIRAELQSAYAKWHKATEFLARSPVFEDGQP